jgi:hypothetical protein
MSAKKTVKRAVKAVWDEVKALRAERGKLYTPADITAAADQLAEKAAALKDLSKQLSALSAMPADTEITPTKRKKASGAN